MSAGMRDLAEDVRATVDFFSSQGQAAAIDRILVTGGGSQVAGLAAAIAGNLPVPVTEIDPFATLTIGDVGLDADQMRQASAVAATAVGLALWPVESPLIRLSVLPDEVAAARRARRAVSLAAFGVAGVAALLAVAGVGQLVEVKSAQSQVRSAQVKVATLTGQVAQLQAATAVHGQVQGRAKLVVQALQGDIDWVRLLGQLTTVMPASLKLTNFSGGTNGPVASTAARSTSTTPGVGTLTFSVQGTGGLQAASAWLQGLQRDHALQGTWIQGISVIANGGQVTFSSTSNITSAADSNRAKAVTP
jgi:Tfp pilus assembly protein PilN